MLGKGVRLGYYCHAVLWLVNIIYLIIMPAPVTSSFPPNGANIIITLFASNIQKIVKDAGELTESFHRIGLVQHCQLDFTFSVVFVTDMSCSCACHHYAIRKLLTNCTRMMTYKWACVTRGSRFRYCDSK